MQNFIDFSALAPITTMNPRSNYDLRISTKTGKITLSEALINRLSLEDNGLNVYSPQNGNIVVSVQPNEMSGVFGGKANTTKKSRTFKADALYNLLVATGSEEFKFVEAGTHNGMDFYTLEPQNVSQTAPTELEESTTMNDDIVDSNTEETVEESDFSIVE